MAAVWGDTALFVRGPACRPSVSGRQPVDTPLQGSRGARHRRSHVTVGISGAGALNLSARSRGALLTEQPQQQRREQIRIVETEDMLDDDEAYVQTQSASTKPLKINMDLLLYRSRLARMQAQLTTNTDERRRLLRQSEEGLRRCLAMDPADPRTYVVLGKLLLQQKRYDEARKLYADGTSNCGNDNPFLWSSWGYLEALTGNVSRARKLFDAATVVDETHSAAWHKWGMLEKKQGNYLRARDLWTIGIQRCRRTPSKSNTYLYCSLAIMASELGKLGEARAWFEEGTRSNSGASSCALWHAWAFMEARIGDPSAVRYLFRRSLQANPRSRYTFLAWAMWERKQRNPQQSLALLRRGQALNPADPAIYQAWAIVEKEQGNYEEARRLFEQGLEACPSHLHLWQAWGVMEFQLQNHERARQLFQQGVWADPGNTNTVYLFQAWGVLEWRTGNHALARELFKAAIKVAPKSESTWSTWIKMEEELGRLDAANELRIRRAEQQWEFVIPPTFTTRPADSSPLENIASTLNRFFKLRKDAVERGGKGGQKEGSGGVNLAAGLSPSELWGSEDTGRNGQQLLLRDLLPPDFLTAADVSVEEVISEAAGLGAASASSSGDGSEAAVASVLRERAANGNSRGARAGSGRLGRLDGNQPMLTQQPQRRWQRQAQQQQQQPSPPPEEQQ